MKKVFSWPCSARWSHTGHVVGRQECNTRAHSAHARAWLAQKKVFAWRSIASWSHASHVLGRRQCNTLAHSARAWLAHGARKFYRCERSYSISLRQLQPSLVRVLLVYIHDIKNQLVLVYNRHHVSPRKKQSKHIKTHEEPPEILILNHVNSDSPYSHNTLTGFSPCPTWV